MRRTSAVVIGVFVLAFLGRANATSVITEVTGENLAVGGFRFDVRVKKKPDGNVTFRVSIAEDGSKFSSHAEVSLSTVEVDEGKRSIQLLRALPTERTPKMMTIEFTVDEVSLEDPSLCLIFSNFVEVEIDGKITPMPSVDFFTLPLHKFTK